MRLVLHPEQVAEVLDLAAELGMEPALVAEQMYGCSIETLLPDLASEVAS